MLFQVMATTTTTTTSTTTTSTTTTTTVDTASAIDVLQTKLSRYSEIFNGTMASQQQMKEDLELVVQRVTAAVDEFWVRS